ncbi:MAG TPA: D-alanyl-D-alanine carboxypeptidase [Candidatus Olsenella pullicola]|nr:D-alanyl-D-alanine carboxypeptidase [Candidatus Olsenella pullicola]
MRGGLLGLALVCTLLAGGAAVVPTVARAAEEDVASTWLAADQPELVAPSAFLVESSTGTVLLDKEADARREPASTTKVMTALLAIENLDLDAQVSVEEADFDEVTADSSVAGLVAGETLSVRDLLACLMLPSGNDASYVLARAVAGDWRTFVDMMNERAAELGCTGTHFANPCGLHDDAHYTTARDLATIFSAAMAYPDFVEIAGAATWDLPATSGNPARTLTNSNLLINPMSSLYMDGTVVAGKTGTTGDAGRCLVVAASGEDIDVIGVVLGVPFEAVDEEGVGQNFYDMRSLVEWGLAAWRTGEIVSPGDALGTAGVTLSEEGDSVQALAAAGASGTVPREMTLGDLTLTPAWEGTDPETGAFQAPIEEGQALGMVDVSLGERWIANLPVVAARSLELSIPAYVMWWLSDPVHAGIVAASFVGLCLVVGLISSLVSRRRRRRRSVGSRHLRM